MLSAMDEDAMALDAEAAEGNLWVSKVIRTDIGCRIS